MSNVRPFLDRAQQARWATGRKLPRTRAEAIAYRARTIDLVDEMEGAGDEGLCWAAHRYDPVEGAPFLAFARVVVSRAILLFLREELRHRKLHVAGYVIASWGASQVAPRSGDALDAMYDGDDVALEKLEKYVDAKVLAGALALCSDAETHADDPERTAETRLLAAVLRAAIATFESKERRLLAAVYAEGKTVEEAGAEVGMAPGTAKARHRALLHRLRKALGGPGSPGKGEPQ